MIYEIAYYPASDHWTIYTNSCNDVELEVLHLPHNPEVYPDSGEPCYFVNIEDRNLSKAFEKGSRVITEHLGQGIRYIPPENAWKLLKNKPIRVNKKETNESSYSPD